MSIESSFISKENGEQLELGFKEEVSRTLNIPEVE